MSARKRLKGSTRHDYSRAVFTGTFTVWQEFLLEKESVFWSTVRLFDYLLRGFSQVVFANNPISGLLITISLGVNAPGTLLLSAITGFLGLLLSVLIQDSQENIANGLTVLNPLLVGAISSSLIPSIYGPFDGFSLLLIILGTIFSVYLTRSFKNNKLPFIAWPFNLAEFALLLVLYAKDNGLDTSEELQPVTRMDNATSDATTGNISFIGENATGIHIDWGMMFHGVIVSASQVLAVESVIMGAVVYLACLLCSPITAGFAFLGALIGSLAGLMLGIQIDEVYAGLWGYNTFLTGASLGTLFAFNGQTAVAVIVAIVYTVIVQYGVLFFFRDLKLPILSLPFVLVASLFLQLRNDSEDKTFLQPPPISIPQEQRRDYLANQQLIQQINDAEDIGDVLFIDATIVIVVSYFVIYVTTYSCNFQAGIYRIFRKENGVTWRILEKYARCCALRVVDILAVLKFVKTTSNFLSFVIIVSYEFRDVVRYKVYITGYCVWRTLGLSYK